MVFTIREAVVDGRNSYSDFKDPVNGGSLMEQRYLDKMWDRNEPSGAGASEWFIAAASSVSNLLSTIVRDVPETVVQMATMQVAFMCVKDPPLSEYTKTDVVS